jgi:hypothetical protein
VVGGYYEGADQDVLTVCDPSLGFTTGGGWFRWPGTGDRTNFGFHVDYTKKGNTAKGSILVIRHLQDGTIYRMKSNAMESLAIGDGDGFDWATFTGKATYSEPGAEPVGNHAFTAYVEDSGTPSPGGDRIWIEVTSDDLPVALSLPRSATDHALPLAGGNTSVPHRVGKTRR